MTIQGCAKGQGHVQQLVEQYEQRLIQQQEQAPILNCETKSQHKGNGQVGETIDQFEFETAIYKLDACHERLTILSREILSAFSKLRIQID